MKIDSNEAGEFHIALSLKVTYHGAWEISVTNIVLNPKELSSFPELVTTLSDLKLILSSLNYMVICCGNSDTKFEELVVLKKGVFMDQSGMYVYIEILYSWQCMIGLKCEVYNYRTVGLFMFLTSNSLVNQLCIL